MTKPIDRSKLGNPGHRRKRKPPTGDGIVPSPPMRLGPLGREHWTRIWTAGQDWLEEGISGGDCGLVSRLCSSLEMREELRVIAQKDPIIKGSRGQIVIHPATTEIQRMDKSIAAMEKALLLPQAERTKLGIVWGPKPESKLDELNARRRRNKPEVE